MNRPHTLAFVSERFLFIAALLSAIVLILSAGALVTTQYRVRLLFVEIERANWPTIQASWRSIFPRRRCRRPFRAVRVRWGLSPPTSTTRFCLKSSRRCS